MTERERGQEESAAEHVPVLCERILEVLAPALVRPNAVVVDATVGLGGHSEAMLDRFDGLRLVGLDRDPMALERSARRLARFGERVRLEHVVFDELPEVLLRLGLTGIDAALFDLGVSSMQLDRGERGFSYARDTALDMRMDQTAQLTAADILNTYSAGELTRILREWGEERFASRIAKAVLAERAREPFTNSARLVELIRAAIPAPARRTGGNPAKRTFQALRIAVNGELAALERALPAAIDAITVAGRVAVLSYHSLEDRVVKRAFAAGATSSAPPGFPVELPEHAPVLRLLARGAGPDEAELAANPRSASARLRAVEKLRAA
ncbi:MAG TPA: 16S rRNA (cytosine(1402)-N(4))-methyltransferase RsmH [Sporichthyaceae bacterium]|nr:16S rRNA (cytosine(1402)-N(4))-methyltransferase RsmH [Sporichthyaceae bacterium]